MAEPAGVEDEDAGREASDPHAARTAPRVTAAPTSGRLAVRQGKWTGAGRDDNGFLSLENASGRRSEGCPKAVIHLALEWDSGQVREGADKPGHLLADNRMGAHPGTTFRRLHSRVGQSSVTSPSSGVIWCPF